MQKKIGMVSTAALFMVLYLIWKDPTGMADTISGFGEAIGGFVADLWDKLGEFFSSLFG
ncbi:MAG TPA: hypothetical protein PLV93_01145 [Microthrixaceae bacterium]|nr:hypothetical protein [Microthrixaceae bacterium]HNI33969.1 hypothetical protein [Microthrixaceae bacterium]